MMATLRSAGVTLPARTAIAVGLAVCLLAGLLQAFLAAEVGIVAALLLPVAAAVVVVVWQRPIAGVQLALVAVPLEFFSVRVGGDAGLSATELLMLLTAGCALSHWALRGRPQIPGSLQALAAVTVAVALSVLGAQDEVVVWKIVLMWSAFTVVGILVANAEPEDLRGVLACLAIGGGIAGFVAVAGGTDQSLIGSGAVATNRAQAGFTQPNVLAFFLVTAIPVAVALSAGRTLGWRLFYLALAGGAVWGLMLTLSRTGLVGTAVALCVLVLWPGFRRVAVVALAALLVFSMFNLDSITESRQASVVGERIATLGRSQTVERDPRWLIYERTPTLIADHPLFGVGAGNFSLVAERYGIRDQGDPFDHAHNVPLTIAAELGLVGLALLVWMVFAVGRDAWTLIRQRGDPRLGVLGLGVAASLAAIVVPSLGDYPPRTNAIAATFFVLVGAAAALARTTKRTG
jgi:O-antigen ligase/polysaccharide polymerase Wzy-like membrane protein